MQRRQRARVDPVVDVAAVVREPDQRRDDPLDALDVRAAAIAVAAEKAVDTFAASCADFQGGCPLGADPRTEITRAVRTLDAAGAGPLNADFYGRSVARVVVMLPWAVSLTMTAIVWRWALNGESGMLNSALRGLGLVDQNIQWLASAATAFPMQIMIGILVTVPFTTTIFLGGLSSIPDDLYEAAALEGAGPVQQFRRITFPLLKPFVNIAIVLNTIYVFNSFPIIWVMTQGGPANSTDILVTHLYKLAFRIGKLGEASAVSLVMLAILLVFTAIYIRLAMRGERA